MAQATRMDTIANNLANVNTTSFKKDQQVFKEFVTSNEKPPEVIQVPKVPASIESFYDHQGGDTTYVEASGTFTDHSSGPVKPTGNPLDVAIRGEGFFEVQRPSGIVYTRNGSFSVDSRGVLVTKTGEPVLRLAEPTAKPEERWIKFQGQGRVEISSAGEVIENGEAIAILAVSQFADKTQLKKMGSSFYSAQPNATPKTLETVQLESAALEGSNVNIVTEMTDMIQTTRMFESLQKAISAYDGMNDKLVNLVGKTTP